MDFGQISLTEVERTDFTLPADPGLTRRVLKQAKSAENLRVYVGCAKWGRKEWVGLIYPEKTREAVFLDEYVKQFNSIELNAVFYGMPKKEQVRTWREKAMAVRNDFIFCPKFTQSISHIRRLKNAEEETTKYLEAILEFGDCLGPAFLQLSDNFGPENADTLREYLERFPSDFELFVEVRHKGWFSDESARNGLFNMLNSHKKGAVITDASGRRDAVHMYLPTPSAFIRFVGNGLHPTDFRRIDAWTDRLSGWLACGLQRVYFFLHQHDEKDTPVLAEYTIRKFNETLGTSIALPQLIHKQNSLF
jgi:uncharacterized protein YecE (DUF72 family)